MKIILKEKEQNDDPSGSGNSSSRYLTPQIQDNQISTKTLILKEKTKSWPYGSR
ncbi:hypothetical protein HYD61_02420 [Mycoplasmopsis bovis]|nr:hypothetical protein [Mycoplasmopsis bovis]QQH60603.1 hypothetical protein HYD61_02420 [Mycoplasmopsis bovis]